MPFRWKASWLQLFWSHLPDHPEHPPRWLRGQGVRRPPRCQGASSQGWRDGCPLGLPTAPGRSASSCCQDLGLSPPPPCSTPMLLKGHPRLWRCGWLPWDSGLDCGWLARGPRKALGAGRWLFLELKPRMVVVMGSGQPASPPPLVPGQENSVGGWAGRGGVFDSAPQPFDR
ncbi:uncharacterized protein LOC128329075 isoform X1 [Hemicordylus capensis]|uniref:uncharacterized protein LOC128329075 isoform X1 n=1 Tax=Hemicordylus capensis TaxID=884348 RepID=UPI00230362F3|nr:uncharacterized protein LOC128329075 isoform X1 [Hemicordylus capensis]